MRKNSPQHQNPKAPEKASSPRLTLRFQPIRPKDDRHGESSKSTSIVSSDPRYQSYCVTMETRENAYNFAKGESSTPSSTGTSCSSALTTDENVDAQLNVVSSSRESEFCERLSDLSTKTKADHQQHGQVSSQQHQQQQQQQQKSKYDHGLESDGRSWTVSGGKIMLGENNNHLGNSEYEDASDGESGGDGRRKRRRESKDSTDSKHQTSSNASNSRTQSRDNKSAQNISDRKVGPLGTRSSSGNEKLASDSDTESGQSDAEANEKRDLSTIVNNSCHRLSPKVPPLKIVIPTTSILEPDNKDRCRLNVSKQVLPYIVTTSSDSSDAKSEAFAGHDSGNVCDKENSQEETRGKGDAATTEERVQRVTRSSQRMAAALATANASTLHGQNVSLDGNSYSADRYGAADSSLEDQVNADMHPRKRKLRAKEGQTLSTNCLASTSHQEDMAVINSYEMYLNIKKQIDRRRQSMFVIQPKPPQGFKDYLMNRCSYVLAGNAASLLSVPMIPPPQSLNGSMKDLFIEQEKERYKLRLQHIIEKEKLVLTVEQEILRVHGRAARALANQSIPLSVCTILKDEEVYNHIEPEQEEKERNARTRYNGRLFLSWLQDVDDKWEKIKESMLLRHHNEAESLHAVQKLDWEWKTKECGTCDATPVIDDISVPMVHVSDDFDLLPA